MKEDSIRRPLRNSLTSGLAYGAGLALGSIVSQLLFLVFSPAKLGLIEDETSLFATGVLLVFLIAMIGGSIGGFVGGWTLPVVGRPRGRWGYAWRSALCFGIPYGTIFYLITFLIYSLAAGDSTNILPQQYLSTFSILGGLLGLAFGLLLGIITVGRRFLQVALAALVGFALGGGGLGLLVWAFFVRLPAGALADEGPYFLLLLGLFTYALLGGSALGYIYDRLAHAPSRKRGPMTRRAKIIGWVVVLVLVLLIASRIWPLLADIDQVMMPRSAGLSPTLESDAVGTHWFYEPDQSRHATGSVQQPAIAAHGVDRVALAWTEGNGDARSLQLASGIWSKEEGETRWEPPTTLSTPGSSMPMNPQVAFGPSGMAHVLWHEENVAGESIVLYARCDGIICSDPFLLSAEPGLECEHVIPEAGMGDELATAGTIAVDGMGSILAVWPGSSGTLAYATWRAGEPSPSRGCVPLAGDGGGWQPRLAGSDESHTLIFSQGGGPDGEITLLKFAGGDWTTSPKVIGTGSTPEVWTAPDGSTHVAWCDGDAGPRYWDGVDSEAIATASCVARPGIGQDDQGRIHVVFSSDELENGSGVASSRATLYESIDDGTAWTPPMIVALPGIDAQPALASSSDGILHLAWSDGGEGPETLAYASQRQYNCEGYELSGAAGAALQVARQTTYRPAGDTVAYCQNQYDQLVFAPNPSPEFSEILPTPNGAYDQLASLASEAQYEVLLATMAYEGAKNGTGPGIALGQAVAELYRKLESDPAQYPRGLTVRILLGNSPPFSTLELNSQLWELLGDLREAGVETMVDPELGWRLEVANFEGAFPHSHTKLMVVDGKRAIASGFNIEFRPLPEDHVSGAGMGDADLGIQVTGPVAQDSRRTFDEIWDGAVQRHCSDFHPAYQVWQATCRDRAATVDHVPEVMRYYVQQGDSTALSMFRSEAYDAADQQIYAALAAARESIDVVHVSFTFPMLCGLNHFYYLCTWDQVSPYIEELVAAVENNKVRSRILVGALPFQGVENTVSVDLLRRELEKRGLSDRVEIRFFDGLVHAKTMLIDDEFLIVGSQNLHYSAFGEGGGLTEYSLGVVDPQAVDDFQRWFNYHWERAQR